MSSNKELIERVSTGFRFRRYPNPLWPKWVVSSPPVRGSSISNPHFRATSPRTAVLLPAPPKRLIPTINYAQYNTSPKPGTVPNAVPGSKSPGAIMEGVANGNGTNAHHSQAILHGDKPVSIEEDPRCGPRTSSVDGPLNSQSPVRSGHPFSGLWCPSRPLPRRNPSFLTPNMPYFAAISLFLAWPHFDQIGTFVKLI